MDKIFQAASGILSSIKRKQGSAACSVSRSNLSRDYPASRIRKSLRITEYLIAARAAIIFWTSLAVVPAEILFDAIETELERLGMEL